MSTGRLTLEELERVDDAVEGLRAEFGQQWAHFVLEAFPAWRLDTDIEVERATKHARRVIRRHIMEIDEWLGETEGTAA